MVVVAKRLTCVPISPSPFHSTDGGRLVADTMSIALRCSGVVALQEGIESQAVDRVNRIGQKKNVHVYQLIAENTIESKVLEIQEKKKTVVQQVCDHPLTYLNLYHWLIGARLSLELRVPKHSANSVRHVCKVRIRFLFN